MKDLLFISGEQNAEVSEDSPYISQNNYLLDKIPAAEPEIEPVNE